MNWAPNYELNLFVRAGADAHTGTSARNLLEIVMAVGEYVSVSSQSDSESADLGRERQELISDPVGEKNELARIYVERGLDEQLANQVAEQLMAKDTLGAHARDELGISDTSAARPVQAALASAGAFSVGGALPLLMAIFTPERIILASVPAATLVFLALLGAVGAKTGGANATKAAVRVTFWGALAMAVTAGIGVIFGTRV